MSNRVDSNLRSVNEIIIDLARQNIALTLWQNYKGLEFCQDVTVLNVCPRYAIFNTSCADRFLEVGKMVYLQSAGLERPLRATVVGKNSLRSRIILSSFRFSTHAWIHRATPRVQPDRPIYAAMSCGSHEITARLIDIQANGIAVVANTNSLEQAVVNPGAVMHAGFQLLPELSLKKVSGMVQNMSVFNPSLTRIGIRLEAGPGLTLVLQKYILHRQEEILREWGPVLDRSLKHSPQSFLEAGAQIQQEIHH
jgi:hypothetical protein